MRYVQAKYTYDSVGAVAKITYHDYAGPEAAGVKKEEYTLTYDNNGNILSEMAYTNYDSAKTVNKSYVYDAIGRLTSATIDGKTTSYTYDAVGNRLTQTAEGKTSTYTYNYLDQLLSINQDGMVIASYTYDDLGNQTKEEIQHVSVTVGGVATGYNKTTDYTYDLRSQLRGTTVKTPQANETTGEVTFQTETTINRYSAAGKRIERVEDNKTTRFYYMGEALLYTTDEGRVLQTENILELNGSIVASKRFEQPDTAQSNPYANQYYFYHYDARGSVTSILNRDGSPVKGYAYDEFGKTEQSGDNAFENEVTFAGSVADLSSGLQYMNARYYQASTGRFLSQDSYTGNAYDPWTQHLYIYCGNNPTSMIDPTGFASSYTPYSSKHNNFVGKYYRTGPTSKIFVVTEPYTPMDSSTINSVKVKLEKGYSGDTAGPMGEQAAEGLNNFLNSLNDNTYLTEQDAALAFAKKEIKNSNRDFRERGAAIWSTISVSFKNGEIVFNTRYILGPTFVGLHNTVWQGVATYGVGSLAICKSVSFVHIFIWVINLERNLLWYILVIKIKKNSCLYCE